MANFKLSPAFESVSKKLGNMVFYNLEGDTFARKTPGKRNKTTPAQDEVNSSFTQMSSNWKYLEGIIQFSWNMHAKKKKRLTGYSAFIGANVNRQRNGEPMELSRPMGEMGLASFSANSGSASGEIICEFVKNAQDSGKYVTFFHQKKENNSASGEIVRRETPEGALSPFTLAGCEPGSEYFVYAVITDKAYGEAETVSIARSAVCMAAE